MTMTETLTLELARLTEGRGVTLAGDDLVGFYRDENDQAHHFTVSRARESVKSLLKSGALYRFGPEHGGTTRFDVNPDYTPTPGA